MTRGVAGAVRLRETRGPTRRVRRLAVAAILLTLAAATGDCAGRAQASASAPAAQVRP